MLETFHFFRDSPASRLSFRNTPATHCSLRHAPASCPALRTTRAPATPGFLLIAVLLALWALPAHAQQEQVLDVSCREVRSLDALQYWFWDGYSGFTDVHDFAHERWGRIALDPSICFRIALVVVDDPQQKAAGYRQAVGELIQWVVEGDESDELDDENAELAIAQLERLTGEDFDTRAEWTEWWQRSRDFMMWSEEEERLIVVTEALESGAAVHDDALVLDAEEYWFYVARGWLSTSSPVGEFIFGSVLIPPHDFNFRIVSAELDDRGAKERGYRRALASMFSDGLASPQLTGARLASIIEQISSITGESFDDRDAWLDWWDANGTLLVLSGDGNRMVVRR